MPCYSPIHAYEGSLTESGKVATVWRECDAPEGVKRDFPCGKCIGCRLERSRQWAMRCMDEASLYEKNCFITLTYNDENLPLNRSLDVSVWQKFMKRLRKDFGNGIRFYMAGEYGSKFSRPHYHALLFNHDFEDKTLFTIRNGNRLYVSSSLAKLWGFGFSSIGDVTRQSAAYVARYVLKKQSVLDVEHYVDKRSGEVLKPEFTCMSRRPGIGTRWYEKFKLDLYPEDVKVSEGVKFKPPRFYDNLLDKEDPDLLESLKFRRKQDAKFESDIRLRVMEQVKVAQISSLKRPLEV